MNIRNLVDMIPEFSKAHGEYEGNCTFALMALITEADHSQLPVIHRLAREIWPGVFSSILSPEQIAYMLEWMYSLPALEAQVSQGHHFLLVKESVDFQGYASYSANPAEKITTLHKIYLRADARGTGLGRALITEVAELARNLESDVLQLNVNRYNPVVSFYEKLGFHIIKEEDNPIGQGFFMNDYVMELSLSK